MKKFEGIMAVSVSQFRKGKDVSKKRRIIGKASDDEKTEIKKCLELYGKGSYDMADYAHTSYAYTAEYNQKLLEDSKKSVSEAEKIWLDIIDSIKKRLSIPGNIKISVNNKFDVVRLD